jgi:hypothetical protein
MAAGHRPEQARETQGVKTMNRRIGLSLLAFCAALSAGQASAADRFGACNRANEGCSNLCYAVQDSVISAGGNYNQNALWKCLNGCTSAQNRCTGSVASAAARVSGGTPPKRVAGTATLPVGAGGSAFAHPARRH